MTKAMVKYIPVKVMLCPSRKMNTTSAYPWPNPVGYWAQQGYWVYMGLSAELEPGSVLSLKEGYCRFGAGIHVNHMENLSYNKILAMDRSWAIRGTATVLSSGTISRGRSKLTTEIPTPRTTLTRACTDSP